jgi:hypothetical protein
VATAVTFQGSPLDGAIYRLDEDAGDSEMMRQVKRLRIWFGQSFGTIRTGRTYHVYLHEDHDPDSGPLPVYVYRVSHVEHDPADSVFTLAFVRRRTSDDVGDEW